MNKCKVATAEECGKDICCYYCEENEGCAVACDEFTCREELERKKCENMFVFDEEKALQEFNKDRKAIEAMKQFASMNRQRKELEEKEKTVRAELEEVMNQYGVKSFENDILKVVYVAPSTKTMVDSKALKKDHPDIYDKYSKTTSVKASVRITAK